MSTIYHVLFYSAIGGLLSLLGGLVLISSKTLTEKLITYASPFAAGALLAAAFFDLIPESMELLEPVSASRWILVGVLTFFLIEYFIHWFHHEHDNDHNHDKAAAPLIVIGDTIHNFIDGIAIGAAFLISPSAGIVTAIAVAAHEIPQEIGDFGVLLKHGYSRTKALALNAFSAFAAAVSAVSIFKIGNQVDLPLGALLAVTAGLFIYIAASDLIPTIHRESKTRMAKLVSAGLLILGLGLVGTATSIAHDYYQTYEHGHSEPTTTTDDEHSHQDAGSDSFEDHDHHEESHVYEEQHH